MKSEDRVLQVEIKDSSNPRELMVLVTFDDSRANIYYHPTRLVIIDERDEEKIIIFEGEGGKDEQDPKAQ